MAELWVGILNTHKEQMVKPTHSQQSNNSEAPSGVVLSARDALLVEIRAIRAASLV